METTSAEIDAIDRFLQRENLSLFHFSTHLQISDHSLLANFSKKGARNGGDDDLLNLIQERDKLPNQNHVILQEYHLEMNLQSKFADVAKGENVLVELSEEDNEMESLSLPPTQYSNNIVELSDSLLQVSLRPKNFGSLFVLG
jgi:hypothetical protein